MKWITQTRNNETCRYSNNNTEKKRDEARKKTKSRDIYTNCQLKYVVVINMLSVCSRKTKIQNLNARTCLYTWMYVYINICMKTKDWLENVQIYKQPSVWFLRLLWEASPNVRCIW